MELVHAALLLHSADKDVNEENVSNVLEGAGIEADSAQVKALIAALEDVDIEEAMTTAVATGAAPAGGAGGAEGGAEEAEGGEAEAEDEAEDEVPEDEGADEEEAAEGLGSLF